MKFSKHSFIGRWLRWNEARNKGWGQLGKQFRAKTKEEFAKALKNGERYYKLTQGS
jgi:hypothetical protein